MHENSANYKKAKSNFLKKMRLSEMLSTKNKLFHILVALLAEPAYGFDMSGRKNCDRLTSGCWSTRKEGVR